MTILTSLVVLLALVATPTAEKTHTLRYDLPVGTSYQYRIATDQLPFPNKVVRLHTLLRLDVVGQTRDMCQRKTSWFGSMDS